MKQKRRNYRELYGDYTTECIILLNKNDLGITQEDEDNPDEKLRKIKLIEEGKNIL